MNAAYSPIESEFETAQAAEAYDAWLRAKVGAALAQAENPTTPRYSTDEVRQRVMRLLDGHPSGDVPAA